MSCASLLLKKVKQHEECHAQGIVVRPWEFLNVETDEVFLKLIIVRGEGRCKCFFQWGKRLYWWFRISWIYVIISPRRTAYGTAHKGTF